MFLKRNLIKFFSVSFVLFLYFNSQTFAAPNMVSTSGTFSHGSTITISGNGFGIKKSVAPVIWDNMESGSFSPSWSQIGTNKGFLITNNDNNRHAYSQYNGFYNFNKSTWDETCGFAGGSDSPKWYVQYWLKLGTNWRWGTSTYGGGDGHLANVKIFRMWSTGSEKDNFVLAFHGWANSVVEVCENVATPNGEAGYFWSAKQDFTLDTWHLLQFEFKDSTVGVQDGEFRMWFDGKLIRETTTLKTRDGSSAYKRPKIVGFYDSWNGGNPGDHHMWLDDAYIDNSFARVEIGDNSIYNDCTHREIQIPTAWGPDPENDSNDLIEFTVNQGSFVNGDTVYLFVVDSEGNVSNGYPVTIGVVYLDP